GRVHPGPVQLGALDVDGRVLEHGILAAVVEVQVGVDDQADVRRRHVQPGERVGGGDVDHAPVVQQPFRPADTGVDQHGAAVVADHEAVHGGYVAVARGGQRGQVQALDLQGHTAIVAAACGAAGAGARGFLWITLSWREPTI